MCTSIPYKEYFGCKIIKLSREQNCNLSAKAICRGSCTPKRKIAKSVGLKLSSMQLDHEISDIIVIWEK